MKPFSFSGIWKGAISLLQPESAICAFCGKPIMNKSGPVPFPSSAMPTSFRRMVCSSCLAGIPWVRRMACPICGRSEYCPDCPRRANAHFIWNRSAVRYDDNMRGVLALYKYRGNEQLEELLADMLMPPLKLMATQLAGRRPENRRTPVANPAMLWDAVTYVPVSREREEERGFNQAERLASGLSVRAGLPVVHLLQRTRHSGKQSFKSRGERMDNTKQLFVADPVALRRLAVMRSPGREPGSAVRLLLVDDIYTTGSTIEACSAALQQSSPFPLQIYAITWARS